MHRRGSKASARRGSVLRIDESNRRWWILAAMGGVVGLILLDETVVGVALPTVRTDLGMSQVASHWVINAYLLVFAGLAAAGGKLGDVLGLKKLFVASVAVTNPAVTSTTLTESEIWFTTHASVLVRKRTETGS